MTTNLFVIANVKQLRTGGSFRILLPSFRTSLGVGVLNSAIFNSFHNRFEFGTILEAFGISGGGVEPSPLGTPLSCSIFVVHQSSSWCTSSLRPRDRLRMNSPHLCRQAHFTWWLDKVLSVCMPYLTPSTNFPHLLSCHGTWRVITLYTKVPKLDGIRGTWNHSLRPYWPTVPFWYSVHSFVLGLDLSSCVFP